MCDEALKLANPVNRASFLANRLLFDERLDSPEADLACPI